MVMKKIENQNIKRTCYSTAVCLKPINEYIRSHYVIFDGYGASSSRTFYIMQGHVFQIFLIFIHLAAYFMIFSPVRTPSY